jgi:glycosyltransferase involved in cell wall biosynthesis
VYCHTPAHWLYQPDIYLGAHDARTTTRAALSLLGPPLRRWDRKAAATADRYLVNSTVVRQRVQDHYRRDAEVLPAPPTLGPEHEQRPVEGFEPGYWLCVSRLLPYKNVDAVVGAFELLGGERLVVVGSGPQEQELRARAPKNVAFLGRVSDGELAWLYANATAVVAAAHEDYGLTPVEAASFGRPAAVLASGGYLDTVVDGGTGFHFQEPTPRCIADAVGRMTTETWSQQDILSHADSFSAARFIERLRAIVAEEATID